MRRENENNGVVDVTVQSLAGVAACPMRTGVEQGMV